MTAPGTPAAAGNGTLKLLVAVIVGAALGFAGARLLFVGSALSLVPWGAAGLLLGLWSSSRRAALVNGAVYGFVLCMVFLLAGYSGAQPIFTPLPLFIALSLFGAVCGLILALAGQFARRFVR